MQSSGRRLGITNFKTRFRMERAVRLELRGLPDIEIAQHIGVKIPALTAMRKTPEYQRIRIHLATGVLSSADEELSEDIVYLRKTVKQHLPAALNVLAQNLQNPDPKIAMAAAESIIDRDGRLAKISRIGLPSEDQGGIGAKFDTSIADGLITTLKGLQNANGGSQTSTASTSTESVGQTGTEQRSTGVDTNNGDAITDSGSTSSEGTKADAASA